MRWGLIACTILAWMASLLRLTCRFDVFCTGCFTGAYPMPVQADTEPHR